MCIIIDANAVGDLSAPTDDGKPVLKWLLKGKGRLIIGGRLKLELARTGLLTRTLAVLDQAGRLKRLDDEKVRSMAASIANLCCSNDSQVVAVALLSGCRLIYTKDHNLQKDMKNRKIIKPTASIYKSRSHERLLTECRCR
jgi:hypothetical protein